MAESGTSEINASGMPLPIRNIGVIYCTSAQSPAGREFEKLADCEIIEVAQAVQKSLQAQGYTAELVDLHPERISDLGRFDWVFNLAETIYGYPLADYEVAQKMEEFNIHFTGSGSRTLRTCLNKAATKCVLQANGIATPDFEVFLPDNPIQNFLEFPLFVKPLSEDGSFGINADSIARNEAELINQVNKIHLAYHQAALVEQYIEGRDITASVIGNGEQAVVLPLSEIIYEGEKGSRYLTFEAKWITESVDYQEAKAHCPCIVPAQIDGLIKDIALRAFRTLGCCDYARIDFRLNEDQPFVLEVNPNPCINPEDSGFVRAATAAGLSYAEMVIKILSSAVEGCSNRLEPGFVKVSEYLLENKL